MTFFGRWATRVVVALAASCAACLPAHAQQPSQDMQRLLRSLPREDAAMLMDLARQMHNPATAVVPLAGGQATLTVPPEMFFVPARAAAALAKAGGVPLPPGFVSDGAVMGRDRAEWIVLLQWVPSGRVPDRAARKWNADDLLQRLREQIRAESPGRDIDIRGWLVPPTYNTASHTLLFGLVSPVHELGPLVPRRALLHAAVLGREGHLRFVMVTPEPEVAQHKPKLLTLLDALIFEPGRRYDDFKPGTDREAERGITALILGKDPEPRTKGEAISQWMQTNGRTLFGGLVVAVVLVLGVLILRARRSAA